MIETLYQIEFDKKACMVSLICPNFESHSTQEKTQHSLNELRELLRTLGLETIEESFVQQKNHLDSATMLGSGKIKEIAEYCKNVGVDTLVFDFELTASQMRNIKKISGLEILDRCMVILEIFAIHAKSNQARLQVEISKLEYMLPRLQSLWTHFSKQKGGIGLKGEGEQQLELDRRIIRQKITTYKKRLDEIAIQRQQQKKKRGRMALTAALIGYTNAGKSSLMNNLCQTDLLSEDKLFATLDSTYRTLNPDTHPPMILVDTVGFIQNLPSSLVEGFKSTLESALEADLLIIVCDLSDPNYQRHLEVTNKIIEDLGASEKPKFIVFTKKDMLQSPFLPHLSKKLYQESFLLNTKDQQEILNLKQHIVDFFLSTQPIYEIFVPYQDSKAHSTVRANTNIMNEVHHEEGIFYKFKTADFLFEKLNLQRFLTSKFTNGDLNT